MIDRGPIVFAILDPVLSNFSTFRLDIMLHAAGKTSPSFDH
jgi:hypothetical protein